MKHVMLDLETMSTRNDAAIVQVGAVEFSMDGRVGEGFKRGVTLRSSQEAGLHVDAETVDWWPVQSPEAQNSIMSKRVPLDQALDELGNYFKAQGCKYVWGNGATFDNVILRSAYRAVGRPCPWHYTRDMDMRTFLLVAKGLGASRPEQVDPPLIKHDALEDAKYPARVVCALAAQMRSR